MDLSMDALDGADNPWADVPPSNATSRDHLPLPAAPHPPAPINVDATDNATGTDATPAADASTGSVAGKLSLNSDLAFGLAFPTPSPTASNHADANAADHPQSSSSSSTDPATIPLPTSAGATSPFTSPVATAGARGGQGDLLSNAFASLTVDQADRAGPSPRDADAAAGEGTAVGSAPKDGDVFTSAFDMSAPSPSSATPAPAPVPAPDAASDPFGFGSFDPPAPAPNPTQTNSDALFGNVGSSAAPSTTTTAAANDFAFSDPQPFASTPNDAGADSDGFGDFGDFSAASNTDNQGNGDDDDDFGDFGDFSTTTDLAPPPPAAPAPAPATAAAPPAPTSPLAPILQSLVSGATLPITGVFDVQQYLAQSAPADPPASPVPQLHIPLVYTAPDGSTYPRVSMNPIFAPLASPPAGAADGGAGPGSFYDDIQRLADAPLFDEHISTRIRWRKCVVKKMFQAALDMPVDWDDKAGESKAKSSAATAPSAAAAGLSPISTSSSATPAAAATTTANATAPPGGAAGAPPAHALSPITPLPDVATLAALAMLTEDELRGKSDQELASVQAVLAGAVPALHAQINYYLDAKEQLALDAEMHNKMISVLVQQAQKSHGRFGKKGSPPKRK